jgi:molecular chaperone DnaK (HSP70)
MDGGSVKIIENSEGDRTTPSVIAYPKFKYLACRQKRNKSWN